MGSNFSKKKKVINLMGLKDFNLYRLSKFNNDKGKAFYLRAVPKNGKLRCYLGVLDKNDRAKFIVFYEITSS